MKRLYMVTQLASSIKNVKGKDYLFGNINFSKNNISKSGASYKGADFKNNSQIPFISNYHTQIQAVKVQIDRLGNILSHDSKKKYTTNNEPLNIISEPEDSFQKSTIRSFSSFEDMENDQLSYFASLSPVQLLQNLKQLVLRSFGIKDEAVLNNMPRIINLNPRS